MRQLLLIAATALCSVEGHDPSESLAFYDPYNFVPTSAGEFSSISARRKKRQAVTTSISSTTPVSTEGKTTRKPVERINIDPKWFKNADSWLTNGDEDDSIDKLWKAPENATFEEDLTYDKEKDTEDISDHQYYKMQTFSADEEKTKLYWVDVDAMLEQPGVTGNRSHPLLKNSYRRAVGAKLSFDFPFYGHKMNNLTIATGGFCYIGDQTHSWLAATQYIAPLMANFDTQLDGSNILYADDGEKFVVEWRKVQLRMQKEYGDFTFQVVLHKNGSMRFVYKDVPIDPMDISDAHHPCKLGISDAYLFHHSNVGSISTMSKRVIYEYHRIEVNATKVRNNTVVLLEAMPTCMSLTSCAACSNATLGKFQCSWCHAKRANGGPFCTDQAGLHRRRQQFIEGNCKDQRKTIYCPTNEAENENEVEEDTSSPSSDDASPTVVPLDTRKGAASLSTQSGSSSSSSSFLLFLLSIVFVTAGWLAYAYYNPQSTSGQLLIRYRPSRWHVPSSHVRYSASVHM